MTLTLHIVNLKVTHSRQNLFQQFEADLVSACSLVKAFIITYIERNLRGGAMRPRKGNTDSRG